MKANFDLHLPKLVMQLYPPVIQHKYILYISVYISNIPMLLSFLIIFLEFKNSYDKTQKR